MFDCTPTHNPHRGLWQEVLLQAVEDALLGPSQLHSWISRLRVCQHARSYLTTPSADLAEVCENAGFDMAAVIEHLRPKIDKAPLPEELAGQVRRQSAVSIRKRAKPDPKPKRVPFPDRPFTINGTTRTAAEWCARFGVPLALAQSRMGRSWAPERAFTMTSAEARAEALAIARQSPRLTISNDRKRRVPSASTPRYTHNGESLTLAQWADRVGLKKGTLAKRIRSGLTLAEALALNLRGTATDIIERASSSCLATAALREIDNLRGPRHHNAENAQGSADCDSTDRDSSAHKCEAHVANKYAHGDCTYQSCPNAKLKHQGQPTEGAPQPCANPTHTSTCCRDHLIHLSNTPKLHSFISNTRSRGVIANFPLPAGTGGVRSAHDFPDLSFSLVTSETPENDRHC